MAQTVAVKGSIMASPFFHACWAVSFHGSDHPTGQGRGGLACPDSIVEFALSNDLEVHNVVTDGNCGLDAFWLACQHVQSLRLGFQLIRKLSQV